MNTVVILSIWEERHINISEYAYKNFKEIDENCTNTIRDMNMWNG